MMYSEMRLLIDRSIEFPIEHERLVEQLGGVELTAPTGDSVAVGDVLTRADEPTYASPEVLYATIVGNLDETFIGRKFYDDRGGTFGSDPRDSHL